MPRGSVCPKSMSTRASDRVTGVGIRIPLCTCTLKAAPASSTSRIVGADDPVRPVPLSLRRGRRPRRPLRAVQRTFPIWRLALRPPFISAGVSSRAAEQSIPPVMQCAHLPFRRKQASSHPLTCHGMVPQASRTHFSGITKPRDFRRGALCWRYLSSQAVSSQVLSAEANLTDLSRDGAVGIPNCTFPGTTKPRDFRRGVLCWRYLSSQAVSSQVLSAEASLTSVFGMGTGGPSP